MSLKGIFWNTKFMNFGPIQLTASSLLQLLIGKKIIQLFSTGRLPRHNEMKNGLLRERHEFLMPSLSNTQCLLDFQSARDEFKIDP